MSGSRQGLTVLLVCLGNICRSPLAHGILRDRLRQAGLETQVAVDSAGTGDWHIGRPPDSRAQEIAIDRGYDISDLRARQVSPDDFLRADLVLAMDEENLAQLEALQPPEFRGYLGLLLDFADSLQREVPDPYYGGASEFARAVDLIEAAVEPLIDHLHQQLASRA